ncbi:ketohexokinase-like isoform X2 [Lycorma delicatula]|uniref:ketohexokinase-like isoform X2 n=1 Tax=Lycorma delicatula TaxID=130591 RepID=UPI003F50D71D
MKGKKILCVGLVCVDVVQVCPAFPLEDTDQSYVTNDFETHNILVDNCVYHDGCDFPLSIVIINSENGSRTIIHSNKNLPELTVEDFKKLDLSCYSWLHFEGRNIQQVKLMMEYAISWRIQHKGQFKISVEIEKARSEQQILATAADVVFVGKDYACFKGYTSMKDTIKKVKPITKPGAMIISAWGESGATGFSDEEDFVFTPANIQQKTVDTLGAGDTFCAAVIFSLNEGYSLKDSVWFGCQIAGAKVGIPGYTFLKQVSDKYVKELLLRSKAEKDEKNHSP